MYIFGLICISLATSAVIRIPNESSTPPVSIFSLIFEHYFCFFNLLGSAHPASFMIQITALLATESKLKPFVVSQSQLLARLGCFDRNFFECFFSFCLCVCGLCSFWFLRPINETQHLSNGFVVLLFSQHKMHQPHYDLLLFFYLEPGFLHFNCVLYSSRREWVFTFVPVDGRGWLKNWIRNHKTILQEIVVSSFFSFCKSKPAVSAGRRKCSVRKGNGNALNCCCTRRNTLFATLLSSVAIDGSRDRLEYVWFADLDQHEIFTLSAREAQGYEEKVDLVSFPRLSPFLLTKSHAIVDVLLVGRR